MSEAASRRQPVSRRDRPAKPPLSREAIVSAARELIRADGEGRLSMRRLAATLDTGPASLYVYFRNMEDLHASVVDDLLGALDLRRGTAPWRERLVGLLSSYTEVLYADPALARTALVTRPNGENFLSLWETLLALFDEGGVPPSQAAWGVDLLLQRATATAIEAATRERSREVAAEDQRLVELIDEVPRDSYPHLAAASKDLTSGTADGRLQWGFDVLIEGIARVALP